MIEIKDRKDCCGCGACAAKCPKKCITMSSDSEGFLYPSVKEELCVGCGMCEKACPILNKPTRITDVTAYAARNKNDDVRMKSSSGGVFYLMAEHIISEGGVVFGAAYRDGRVQHICIEKTGDIPALQGSKYVQSDISHCHSMVKQYLDEGKAVLFGSTPCQINGLLSYLGKSYENLYTQDIVCHGVPSPGVFEKYKKHLSKNAASDIKNANFRCKDSGWRGYSTVYEFENGQVRKSLAKDDLYMRAFLKNYTLRPSCGDCRFKGINRSADITLADFWGVEKIHPEIDDNKGTSLVFIHTQKGKELFDKISPSLEIVKTDPQKAAEFNPSMTASSAFPADKDSFMTEIMSGEFDRTVEKYCKVNNGMLHRILSKTKRILKSILKGR